MALVQQVIGVLATYTSGQVGWNATNSLRSDLARHALSLDMPFHNSNTPGAMIERIDGDAQTLGRFFSTFAVHILGNSIMLIAVLALLFREDWRVGLALSTFALISLVVIIRMRNVSVANWKANREASTATYGFIEERLAGREDIRTSAAQPYVMKGYFDHMWRWFRIRVRAAFVATVVANITEFMFSVGMAMSVGRRRLPVLGGHDHHRHGVPHIPVHAFGDHANRDCVAGGRERTAGWSERHQNRRASPHSSGGYRRTWRPIS